MRSLGVRNVFFHLLQNMCVKTFFNQNYIPFTERNQHIIKCCFFAQSLYLGFRTRYLHIFIGLMKSLWDEKWLLVSSTMVKFSGLMERIFWPNSLQTQTSSLQIMDLPASLMSLVNSLLY